MKLFGLILLFLAMAAPAWAGRKITVSQLEEMMRSMQRDKKSDSESANALKQVELSEQLTRDKMSELLTLTGGPLSTEQIYVLEASSASLVPPASEVPSTPAPDATAQKSMLMKAETYVERNYSQLPVFTATRTTLRFQDNVEAVASSSGVAGSARDVVTGSSFSNPASFIHYINSSEARIAFEHGAEKLPQEEDKTPWGANRMIALLSPDPNLATVFRTAQQSGTLQWQRWELVNGKPAGVFSFSVPRKLSKLDVKVCCFPNINQTGVANFYTATTANTLGPAGATGGGVSGNYQTNTDWHDFKTIAPYHGEFFIDPDSGIVVRMITEAEMKPSEVVHQVDTRIDYGPVKLGASMVVAPVRTYVNTVVVPGGDSQAGTYTTRCTLFTSVFKDYQTGGAK